MYEPYQNGRVFALKDLLPYEEGKIVNADIVNNPHMKMALMSFDAGCATLNTPPAAAAMMLCLEGEGVITNEGVPHTVQQGRLLLPPRRDAQGRRRHPVQNDGHDRPELIPRTEKPRGHGRELPYPRDVLMSGEKRFAAEGPDGCGCPGRR